MRFINTGLILSIFLAATACSNRSQEQVSEMIGSVQGQLGGATGASVVPSQSEALLATKEALGKGVEAGIQTLAKNGGFADSVHRVLIPADLRKITDLARKSGLNPLVDRFESSLNLAAEEAVKSAAPVFKNALSQMTVTDVVDILRGPPNAATQYFQKTSETKLNEVFLPIVKKATDKTEVTQVYKQLIGSIKPMLALSGLTLPPLDLDQYVTEQSSKALFAEIAVQEKKIRENPLERSNALLKKVFGYYESPQT